jgi:type I restriction enzyme S subunit
VKTRTVQLGEVCEINPATDFDFAPDDACSFVPMEAVGDVDARIERPRTRPFREVAKGYTPFAENDVIVAKITPCMENGKCAVARNLRKGIGFGSTEFHVLRATRHVIPEWLFYFWRFPVTRKLASANMTGSAGQKRVPASFLETVQIPLPPLSDQQRIAGQLEQADGLRRTRRYALELTNTFLPAAFLQLFGDPVRNTKGWPVITVEEAGAVQLGRQRAPKYQTGQFRTPYIRVANVYENEIDLSDLLYMDFDASDFAAYKLGYGDILLNEGQSTELVGRPAMWRNEIPDCCFQNTLVRFRASRKLVDPAFALWLFINYLQAGEFAKISAKTSSVAHLGAFRLAQMRFPLAPLPLQQQFAALVERVERLRSVQREFLRQADHLFASLLHTAFATG